VPGFMLDTDVCIDVMRGRSAAILSRLERVGRDEVAVSAVVAAELWTGVSKSADEERSRNAVKAFLAYVIVLDWPAEAATLYGEIRARLETAGRSIGAMDLLIAAHALHQQAALVTRNQTEFRRVSGLRVLSWT
jgi:tRNA(fMet)-specific endonuclease VapC